MHAFLEKELVVHGVMVSEVAIGLESGSGGGAPDDFLQVRAQAREHALVDAGLQHRTDFEHAGHVIVGRELVQAGLAVVPRTVPLHRIKPTARHRGGDLARRGEDGIDPQSCHHVATHAPDAHLETFEVIDVLDLPLEPPARLRSGRACQQGLYAGLDVSLFPQLLAAAEAQPSGMLVRGQSERDIAEEPEHRMLSGCKMRRRMQHLSTAIGNSIEGRQCGRELARGEHAHCQTAAGHRIDHVGQALSVGAEPGRAFRPSGGHAQLARGRLRSRNMGRGQHGTRAGAGRQQHAAVHG